MLEDRQAAAFPHVLHTQAEYAPVWLETGDVGYNRFIDAPALACMNFMTTAMVQHLFPRLLAGGRQAQRIAQLCAAPGLLAGKGVPVGSSSEAAPPSMALLHHPPPVPHLPTHPLGYLDPEARRTWMAGQPGLYTFTAEGYVGVVPQAVYRLAGHNAFAVATGVVGYLDSLCMCGEHPDSTICVW
jgi:hypothetical protein